MRRMFVFAANGTTSIAGINGSVVTGAAVYVTSSGQLGVLASSERYKTEVAPMGANSAKLRQLRPVRFHLKTDPTQTVQYGLIAEEVGQVYPELVIRNESGQIEGVRYEELAPMLLNEVQQQQAKMTGQAAWQKKIMAVQAAEIRDLQQQLAELQGLKRALQAAIDDRSAHQGRTAQH
jgi:hypothetical protein